MRYFLDTEFLEDGRTIELISIGLVAEDGRELYVVSNEFDPARATPWLNQHVMPHLGESYVDVKNTANVRMSIKAARSRAEIRHWVEEFTKDDADPEFWAYFADYDWVVFAQLWGTMMGLPDRFPKFCLDLKQWARQQGIRGSLQDHVPMEGAEHRAIDDARWNEAAYGYLWAKEITRPSVGELRAELAWALGELAAGADVLDDALGSNLRRERVAATRALLAGA